MGHRTGLDAQLAIGEETTWGTRATPARFLEFVSEGLKNDLSRVESKALRATQSVLRTDRWKRGTKNVSGSAEFEVANKGFGLLFKHMLGSAAEAASGTGWKRTYTVGDLFGKGLTIQVGRPGVGGTVHPFDYLGCKIPSWELSNAVNDLLSLKVDYDGREEKTDQSLEAASYPASQELFVFTEGAVTIGGTSYPVDSWSLSGTNGLKADRFKIDGNDGKKSEQLINQMREFTGQFGLDFIDLTNYNRFVNGTLATVVLTYTTVSTYDTGLPFKLVITIQNARFDGETPNVSGPDVVAASLPFKALDDGTNSPVKIEYYTSDSDD